jgi:hypothetical protein
MVQGRRAGVRAPAGARVPAARLRPRPLWPSWLGLEGFQLRPFRGGQSRLWGRPQDEAQSLKEEQAYLQNELTAIQQRIVQLESS